MTSQSSDITGLSEADLDDLANLWFKTSGKITQVGYSTFKQLYQRRLRIQSDYINLKKLHGLAGLEEQQFPCCSTFCMAFTGKYSLLPDCLYCHKTRPATNETAYTYIPLAQQIRSIWRDDFLSVQLRYRKNLLEADPDGEISDVWDSQRHLRMKAQLVTCDGNACNHKYFSDPLDMGFGLMLDGFNPAKRRATSLWPVILLNYSLPPEIRYKNENVLVSLVIPGCPKDMDSFLRPLIEDLKEIATEGVLVYDAAEKQSRLIRCYLHSAGGDGPALCKLCKTVGAAGALSCRTCHLKGTYDGVHYYPVLRPPSRWAEPPHTSTAIKEKQKHSECVYNPLDLPLRTHAEMLATGSALVGSRSKAAQKALRKESGLSGLPARCPAMTCYGVLLLTSCTSCLKVSSKVSSRPGKVNEKV